ncbi:GNAT family N-acetyltransferase [Oerskovia sp. M15]
MTRWDHDRHADDHGPRHGRARGRAPHAPPCSVRHRGAALRGPQHPAADPDARRAQGGPGDQGRHHAGGLAGSATGRVGPRRDRGRQGHARRLAVAPDLQGRGIGTQMLFAVLPHLPEETTEIWVFTGKDSKQNLELYTRHGYEEQYDKAAGDLTYTYLRRILGEAEARNASDAVGQD